MKTKLVILALAAGMSVLAVDVAPAHACGGYVDFERMEVMSRVGNFARQLGLPDWRVSGLKIRGNEAIASIEFGPESPAGRMAHNVALHQDDRGAWNVSGSRQVLRAVPR